MNQFESDSLKVASCRRSVQMPHDLQYASSNGASTSDEPTQDMTSHNKSPPTLSGMFHVKTPQSASPHSATSSFSQDTEDANGRRSFAEQGPLYKSIPDDWIRGTSHHRSRSHSAVSGHATEYRTQAIEETSPPSNRQQAHNVGKRVKSAFKDMFKRDLEAEKDTTKIETKHWAEDDY